VKRGSRGEPHLRYRISRPISVEEREWKSSLKNGEKNSTQEEEKTKRNKSRRIGKKEKEAQECAGRGGGGTGPSEEIPPKEVRLGVATALGRKKTERVGPVSAELLFVKA